MRRREPKRQGVTGWPRPDIAADREGILQFNYQNYFLRRVGCLVPVVINSLISTILPPYHSSFKAESDGLERWESLAFDKKVKHHPDMAVALFDEALPQHRWEGYEEVKELLQVWMAAYSLNASWVAREALNALLYWTRYGATYVFDPETGRPKLPYGWPIQPILPQHLQLPPPVTRVFEYRAYPESFDYSGWDLFDLEAYQANTLQQFKNQFSKQIDQIRAKLKPAVVVSFPEPKKFDMLALYLCGGYSPAKIAKVPGLAKDTSGILRDIKNCGQLLSLPLKRVRGRKR